MKKPDIVERLRRQIIDFKDFDAAIYQNQDMREDAADEIEALRDKLRVCHQYGSKRVKRIAASALAPGLLKMIRGQADK